MNLNLNKINSIINCEHITDANNLKNIQGWYHTSEDTINLPDELYTAEEDKASCYGVLFTSTIDWDNCNWGIQLLYPIDGKYSHSCFIRINFTSDYYGDWIEFMNRKNMQDTWNWIDSNDKLTQQIQDRVNGLITNDITTSFPEDESSWTLTEELIDIWDNIKALQQGPDISDLAFGNFALIDNATEGCTSAGTLSTDLMASNGKAYSVTTTTTSKNVFSANFSDVKFGKYSLCIRVRVSNNTSSSAILNINIFDGSTSILSKNILGTNFDSNTKYCYICTTFNYEGSSSTAKQPLTFSLYSTSVSGITVYFDYAYISLLTPAVYI